MNAPENITDQDSARLTRREFLVKTGWSAAGLTVLASCSGVLPALPERANPELEDAAAWVQMLPGGQVRFYCPRMEMGQGPSLGLVQVVAEELNIPAAMIERAVPATGQVVPFKMTVGSESIKVFFDPVSYAAASLRESLRLRAAQKFKLAATDILDRQGGFTLADGRTAAYTDLLGETEILEAGDDTLAAPPGRYALTRRGRYNSIGKAFTDGDIEGIVTGKTRFSRDAALPDMAHGGVLMPPDPGARLKSVDPSRAEKMPGVIAAVVDLSESFAGIVAEAAHQVGPALDAIKARWELGDSASTLSPADEIRAQWEAPRREFEHELLSEGDIGKPAAKDGQRITSRYQSTLLAHAAMEPRAGLAWVQKDKVQVWCGTQAPFFIRNRIAQILGRGRDQVILHPMRMGGGFGGRVPCQPAEHAAILSARSGRPVKVQWSREDEFRQNYFQPPYFHEIEAEVTPEGKISHWRHDFMSAPIIFTSAAIPENLWWVFDMLADFGTSRGALPPYAFENALIRYSDIRIPVPTGAWRGLGAAPNAFAIESMVDELAVKAGIDPLQLRLKNLRPGIERLGPVLKQAAKMAGWGRPTAPGTGLGLAGAVYRGKTHVAAVAEVRIGPDQELSVEKVWCAQDCGLVLNPDQVEQQIIGNVIWGCGMALGEEMNFKGTRPETDNFDGYQLLRQAEAPDVEVALIQPPGAPPVGAGEPAIAPVAAAIANAVHAAGGGRRRRLPIGAGPPEQG
ncbi:MAG: molybdopterin-dependent oxidoreductase [Rhodospirillales bacterium]|nr:molybdopterin-dependent oxidoreductase [Rhodospirillales bacterium]